MHKLDVRLVLEQLELLGFTCRFLCFEGLLQCIETSTLYKPEELQLISVHRFEGSKDLDDLSVIYAVTDGAETKGLIMDAYGPYEHRDLGHCVTQLRYA